MHRTPDTKGRLGPDVDSDEAETPCPGPRRRAQGSGSDWEPRPQMAQLGTERIVSPGSPALPSGGKNWQHFFFSNFSWKNGKSIFLDGGTGDSYSG